MYGYEGDIVVEKSRGIESEREWHKEIGREIDR